MSLVDEARAFRERIAARISELEPLVREYNELQQIAAAMGVVETPAASESSPLGLDASRRSTNPPAPRRRAPTRGGRGRRATDQGAPTPPRSQGGGDLAHRVLAAAQADPGKTVADYAEALGVAPTTLYRPVRQLTSEGVLVKRARQLFPR